PVFKTGAIGHSATPPGPGKTRPKTSIFPAFLHCTASRLLSPLEPPEDPLRPREGAKRILNGILAAGVKPHVKLAAIDRIMDIYGLASRVTCFACIAWVTPS